MYSLHERHSLSSGPFLSSLCFQSGPLQSCVRFERTLFHSRILRARYSPNTTRPIGSQVYRVLAKLCFCSWSRFSQPCWSILFQRRAVHHRSLPCASSFMLPRPCFLQPPLFTQHSHSNSLTDPIAKTDTELRCQLSAFPFYPFSLNTTHSSFSFDCFFFFYFFHLLRKSSAIYTASTLLFSFLPPLSLSLTSLFTFPVFFLLLLLSSSRSLIHSNFTLFTLANTVYTPDFHSLTASAPKPTIDPSSNCHQFQQ